jgi:uncharacterized coiled-coil protein SlyX
MDAVIAVLRKKVDQRMEHLEQRVAQQGATKLTAASGSTATHQQWQ